MYITKEIIEEFKTGLLSRERAKTTAEQYARAVNSLFTALGGAEITHKRLLNFKKTLTSRYAPPSVNAIIIGINSFLDFIGLGELRLRCLKLQRRIYNDAERELCRNEIKTLEAASEDKPRLNMIIKTLSSTGIRVSELRAITVEAVNSRRAEIDCKGKQRTILLPDKLCKRLRKYAKRNRIYTGCIFITKNGNPIDRSNLSNELKRLAKKSGVSPKKVFAHAFRHFFARMFYNRYKDIVKLADILGHSSIDTTRIYTRESSEICRRQLDNLFDILE